MARQTARETGKIRVLAIYRMLQDGKHMTTKQILDELWRCYRIEADRKTIYNDIAAIDRIMPIKICAGPKGGTIGGMCLGNVRIHKTHG